MPNSIVETCASTNDLARTLGEAGCADGTWISALIQTAGRGRQGRRWVSDVGNLFLSMVFRSIPRERHTWVPLAAAVATREAIMAMQPKGHPLIAPLLIKWPNDLWLNHAKCGGILGESVNSGSSSPFLIVGIGVNCVTLPHLLPIDEQPVANVGVPADELRLRVIECSQKWIRRLLLPQGTRQIAREYDEVAAFPPGTLIEWNRDERGQVQGLGEWAELCVVDSSRNLRKLMSEDVRVANVRASRKAGD